MLRDIPPIAYPATASIRPLASAGHPGDKRGMNQPPSQLSFPPTRAEALSRLDAFLPRAGWRYASHRNADLGPERRGDTSVLSPYVRRRMVDEREIVAAVLEAEGPKRAEKFIQEVCWRTYWKGWLEARPEVWTRFLEERDAARDNLGSGAAKALAQAEAGTTGFEGFDDWARELVGTGWMHNHARMWFSSIWIFTLGLPWQLGADFFLRHLLDADPASNTLSWRWTAGLQTKGKTYLATAANIARYTEGRFEPKGLATRAEALHEEAVAKVRPLGPAPAVPGGKALLLVTDEDLTPDWLGRRFESVIVAGGTDVGQRGSRGFPAAAFASGALDDAATRLRATGAEVARLDTFDAAPIIAAAERAATRIVVTPYAPVGATATALDRVTDELAAAGLTLLRPRSGWDTAFWPHATRGYSQLRNAIPDVLAAAGLAA